MKKKKWQLLRAAFCHAVPYIIKYDRRFESTGVAPRTKSCRLCVSTWILTCSIVDVLSRVSVPRGARVYPLTKEQTPRTHVLGYLFSFAAGSLDQRFFPYCILSIIPSCDWFPLQTCERKKGRKNGRERERESKRKRQKRKEKKERVETREQFNSFPSGENFIPLLSRRDRRASHENG